MRGTPWDPLPKGPGDAPGPRCTAYRTGRLHPEPAEPYVPVPNPQPAEPEPARVDDSTAIAGEVVHADTNAQPAPRNRCLSCA